MLRIDLDVDFKALAKDQEHLDGLPNRFVAAVLARMTAKLKDAAPADTGQLVRSGRHEMTGYGEGEITFDTNYSRFVHDGRGKGGINYFAIQDWVKSKGIDPDAAFPIARSIAKKGTRAQPWATNFVHSKRMQRITQDVMRREASRVA